MLSNYTSINQIDTTTPEGKILIAAIIKLTTESQKDKEPDEVLQQCAKLAVECELLKQGAKRGEAE